MTTPAKVQEWLRNNEGNLTDAYKAVNYSGPPLKIKGGNLTNNRSKIRLSQRGENGDSTRKAATKIRPPQGREEQNRNRRQNYRRASIRKKGGSVVIDHKIDLNLLYNTVKDLLDPTREIERLEQSYGPLGDRPDNRQIISAKTNEIKNQQTRAVQSKLGKMESRKPSLRFDRGTASASFKIDSSLFSSPTVNESHPLGGNVIDTDPLGGNGLPMRTP